ncbi:MAG: hypothetical protein K8T25_13525 [Planctomycetia bacterium]|nr:hypothetical protein [Planctomycetia bacterium]
MSCRWGIISAAMFALAYWGSSSVLADGGTVRCIEQAGTYWVTVFTDPTPLRVGPAEVSVLVQDAADGSLIDDCRVEVTLTNIDVPTIAVRASAVQANKLVRAAAIELPTAGRWRADVAITGRRGSAKISVPLDAAAAPPKWRDMLFWILAPTVPIGLFALREALAVSKRSGRRSAASPSTTTAPL